MADAGEGEDEIQFLRTVSAMSRRASSQGKGRPGSHQPGGCPQSDSRLRGQRRHWDTGGVRITACLQVCVSSLGRAGRVSVRACGKPREPSAVTAWLANGRYPGGCYPVAGSGTGQGPLRRPQARVQGCVQVGRAERGDFAVAIPGALGLSLCAVTERGHRSPRTWHSSHSEWPRAEEAAPRVPPSQDDTSDSRACSGGPHGSRHGAVVIL